MVLAGPGTGKTRLIIHRIEHMLQVRGVDPERIVAVTYTVKAAQQLRERLAELPDIGPTADRVHAHTFHGLGYRIVRRFGDVIGLGPIGELSSETAGGNGRGGLMDSAQQKRLLRNIVLERQLFPQARGEGVESIIASLLAYHELLANAAITPAAARGWCVQARQALDRGLNMLGKALDDTELEAERVRVQKLDEAAEALILFDEARLQRRLLTFSDFITLPIEILRTSGPAASILRDEWRHMVVDEFQDANLAQLELLRLLMPPTVGTKDSGRAACDLCVVGDDDQSIYGFRGADDQMMDRFCAMWPSARVLRLTQNYRSAKDIVDVSNSIVSRATYRFAPDKKLVAAGENAADPTAGVEVVWVEEGVSDGEVIASMLRVAKQQKAQVRSVEHTGASPERKWASMAVVAKSHKDLSRIRAALTLEGIPSIAKIGPVAAHDAAVKDVLAWVYLIAEPHASHALLRLLTRPPFSMPAAAMQQLMGKYRAALSRFQMRETGTADPGGCVTWLLEQHPELACAAVLGDIFNTISTYAAEHSAAETIFRIITLIGAVHADLPSSDARAQRVAALVALVRFARERQPRLEAPGDTRSFWSYYQDLDETEREFSREDFEQQLDGDSLGSQESADGVMLLTAHSAKGLEFDTVFVAQVTPKSGFGKTRDDDGVPMPEGLVRRPVNMTSKERAVCEERRLFYVACTRAERRLILLSPKLKNPSRSIHYSQELLLDPKLARRVASQSGLAEVQRATTMGVIRGLQSAAGDAALSAVGMAFAPLDRRRFVFEDAVRELRLATAGALDQAAAKGSNAASVQAAAQAAEHCVRLMGALQHARTTGAVPAWADDAVRLRIEHVLAQTRSEPSAAPTTVALPPMRAPLSLSYTLIEAYLSCPRCFAMNHVLGLRQLPSGQQIVGICVHQALQKFYERVREAESQGATPPRPALLLELGRQMFYRHWPTYAEVDKAQLDKVLAQLKLVEDRFLSIHGSVLEIERSVHFSYGRHRFTAKLDRVDAIECPDGRQGFRVVDYKTGQALKKFREPAADDLQLGIYLLSLQQYYNASPANASETSLDDSPALPLTELSGTAEYWLLSTGERGCIALDAIDLDKVKHTIDGAIKGMLSGDYPKGKACGGECAILDGLTIGSWAISAPEPIAPADDSAPIQNMHATTSASTKPNPAKPSPTTTQPAALAATPPPSPAPIVPPTSVSPTRSLPAKPGSAAMTAPGRSLFDDLAGG